MIELNVLNKKIDINKLVSKYELEEIEANENSFFYVIEIYFSIKNDQFYSRIYRKDFFTLKPSFMNGGEEIFSDDQLLIEDSNFINEDFFETEEKALNNSLEKIKIAFS